MNEKIINKDVEQLRTNISVTSTSALIVIVTVLLLVASAVVWLFGGTVTEKAYTRGIVFPADGLTDVTLPNAGVVLKMFVCNGEKVAAGGNIALVSVNGAYSVLKSHSNGTVFSAKQDNEAFAEFEPIVSILSSTEATGEVICRAYTDLDNLRDIRVGQEAQVWPHNQFRDQTGYVRGVVTKVFYSPVGADEAAKKMRIKVYDEVLFPKGDVVYEMQIALKTDRENPAELDWTFESDEHPDMSCGTLCDAIVITRRMSVFEMLFMKSKAVANRVREWVN